MRASRWTAGAVFPLSRRRGSKRGRANAARCRTTRPFLRCCCCCERLVDARLDLALDLAWLPGPDLGRESSGREAGDEVSVAHGQEGEPRSTLTRAGVWGDYDEKLGRPL